MSATGTDRIWIIGTTAITLTGVDFADPALAGEPDVRERGARLEVRPRTSSRTGSVYASDPVALGPAVVRVDLLESAPGAADRMHWHPTMHDGEPGDRTFDVTMPQDPAGWLRAFLADLGRWSADAGAVADLADEIADAAGRVLETARRPWPVAAHDERGLAPLS
ncbi:hypothetical protein GCM10011519_19510 [Marmoricola endophyticus]|uniref:Uncharacterized protein n=1 Tax=Marmoricola endophyticus TaxID=2040280 RepID=A0A917BIS0_9ACTN|nr:hypothetical protein [Marmoricola endophyticus]GGF45711.1 hypothetical protein GCM10011519_19510 [Marmoricola endophyticus]